jgi:hypothetical protein
MPLLPMRRDHAFSTGRTPHRASRRPALEVADLRAVLMPQEDIPTDALWPICVHEAGHAVAALAISYGKLRRCIIDRRTARQATPWASTTTGQCTGCDVTWGKDRYPDVLGRLWRGRERSAFDVLEFV